MIPLSNLLIGKLVISMRVHSALHLLSVVIPLPVTGGSISDIKGRLDFNMPDLYPIKRSLKVASTS